jgi:DNA replication ATP-dependent helicase Dna2
MAIHDALEIKQECFLCTLDPRRACYKPQLEGRILAAYERSINGTRTSIIILETGTSSIELHLPDQYYRRFIGELKARRDLLARHTLTLRIYHLPTAPLTTEYKGQERLCYQGNAYTLAVIEPDTLLNITDLNLAEYCPRQYQLNRLSASTTSLATLRGNLVHYCFKELLKEHDRGHLDSKTNDVEGETPLEALNRYLEQALHLYSLDIALANVTYDTIRAEVTPHLESLAHWYTNERQTLWDTPTTQEVATPPGKQVRAETFLLAPEIGLRGRLDLFWQQADRQRLLELKTGGASGSLPKREHRWQVYGYHSLLTVRRNSKMKKALATLLYSGTPGKAEAFGIPSTIREIQRVNETRNTLVLSHITGVPPAPPGPHRCTRCSMLDECQSISSLLQWEPPQVDNSTSPRPATNRPRSWYFDTTEDREFFNHYYQLLQIEGRIGEQQQALLWKIPVAERLELGTAISGLEPLGESRVEKDGWEQTFRCLNTSELREGDEILLSNGDPIAGEVVTGTLLKVSAEEVTVWTRELISSPTLIDRYSNDLVHVRTLQNLLRWLQTNSHLRDLVAGKVRPRFIEQRVTKRDDFNAEQNLAVERALQMQDYLLIHGPPGTGKTSVIAEIIKRLTLQGQRVMLAAFTNQAVDNMLKRLDKEGFHDYLRLGHERSVEESIQPRLLKELVGPTPDPEKVREVLSTIPVVASTTATWSSDKYASQGSEDEQTESNLYFDVAIIDEAGQLTVPAILGALRFARRFILVGDEKQLPPLVLSKEAAELGLAASLFSTLKRLDDDYMQNYPMSVSACVPLRTQYRMNKWISHFSSTVFYDRQLVAHESIANRRLTFTSTPEPAQDPMHADSVITRALDPLFPLVFVDVHEKLNESDEDNQVERETKTSNAEAQVIRNLVAALLMRGIEQKDIGIIAPYRAQVATIRRHLFSNAPESNWQALSPYSPISVDTVDRFQGGERMVIIISFATTSEPAENSPRRDFLTNPHRLNVALTRAQRKLILTGCVPALERLPIFSRLITYCRSMNTLIAPQEYARL